MRKYAPIAILAAALAGTGAPALAADPVVGIWQTRPDDNGNFGHVQIKPCGPAFCGTLIRSFGPDGKPIESRNIGRKIVWDMIAYGNGLYDDGKIWAPDRDKTYDSEMHLSGNSLEVKGCVIGICRSGGVWKRVK